MRDKQTENETTSRRPPTELEWKLLYEAFQLAKAGSNDPYDQSLADAIGKGGRCGFRVPIEVKQVPFDQ